jgi:hypothetical protein
VIRFSCPTCRREYLLADALARLPLLCKGCGQHLDVPEPQQEAPTSPEPAPEKPKTALPVKEFEPDRFVSPVNDSEVDQFLSAETQEKLRKSTEASDPLPVVKPEKHSQSESVPPEEMPSPHPSRQITGIVVDGAVAIVLLVVGMFVGEAIVGKTTGQILSNITGPKFPPTDLLLWLGCVGFFGLIYAWLGTRGWTLGGWLKRRPS